MIGQGNLQRRQWARVISWDNHLCQQKTAGMAFPDVESLSEIVSPLWRASQALRPIKDVPPLKLAEYLVAVVAYCGSAPGLLPSPASADTGIRSPDGHECKCGRCLEFRLGIPKCAKGANECRQQADAQSMAPSQVCITFFERIRTETYGELPE
jgi:hypothetical protein